MHTLVKIPFSLKSTILFRSFTNLEGKIIKFVVARIRIKLVVARIRIKLVVAKKDTTDKNKSISQCT